MKRLASWIGVGALLVAVAAAGCGVKDTEGEWPGLPPTGTMKLDLSAFSTTRSGKADDLPRSNFNAAALRVGLLEVYAVVALTAPVAVLAAALSVEPTWEDGKWIWDYSVTTGGHSYRAVLSGWFDGNIKTGVWLNLEMKVSCSACQIPLTNFVWYTGRYNTSTGAEGYWQFFDPAIEGGDQTSVRIDYTYTDESHRSLDVENKRTDGHENAGDTIAYALAGADLTLAVHDESESLDYTAGIDVNTGAGYIQVPNYNNGEKACWDENQLNADCL